MTTVAPGTVLAVVGPTAAGKSDLALAVAPVLGAEIVSCDGAQVYRGMDVGTAKATVAQRAAVAHHCLDLADPGETFSAGEYQRHARAAIEDIRGRGRVPLLVGGTGLYLRAAVDDIDFGGPPDPVLRDELSSRPLPDLVAQLACLDPARAARTDLANPRRVVRAIELARESPGAGPDPAWTERRAAYPVQMFVLAPLDREELRALIAARVERMLEAGWLDEVAALRATGRPLSPTAVAVIGYRELGAVLDGEAGLEEAKSEIVRRTRGYARRQLTWFRREQRATWLWGDAASGVPALLKALGV